MKEFACLKLDMEEAIEAVHQVVEEMPLSVFVNGRHFTTAMISPAMIKEFVIGHLFSERIVDGIGEIESLEIEKNVAKVVLTNPIRAIRSKRPILSGCGGSSSFLDGSNLPTIVSDLKINSSDLRAAVREISMSDLHVITGGVHSVGLFERDGIICKVEDIGRHSALDKVIGYGLLNGTDFSGAFVASTGRISSDMALKCSAANLPIIASRGATTSFAIEIGSRTGLSIIGFVRGRKMNVYTNWDRVKGYKPAESPASD